jgi:hypothetical protein
MFLTPTYIGALLAGALFWCLFWVTLHKFGEIPLAREWNRSHQSLALVITEDANLLLCGITAPAGILFTLGGTGGRRRLRLRIFCQAETSSRISARIWRSA